MNNIIKIGNIELTENEARDFYENGRIYFVTYSKIYYLDYSKNAGFHGREIYRLLKKGEHFTKKGRFFAYDAGQINHLLGFHLLNV